MRGWLLFNLAAACHSPEGMDGTSAVATAVVIESLLFSLMHLPSPGGSKLSSLANIFIGGIAGGVNVLLTGSLGFSLGWHFGWNIFMGNVWGLSTSGIPISATVVSVAPHPEKEARHGGVFGPEGGMMAPIAYAIGIALLYALYGTGRLGGLGDAGVFGDA